MNPGTKLLALLLLLFCSLRVLAQKPCATNYTSIGQALNFLYKDLLPTDKFNSTCMSQQCPGLSAMACPFNADQTLNNAEISQILSAIQACLLTRGTLCDTPINPVPLCTVGVSLQPALPGLPISGFIAVGPNRSFLTGLNGSSVSAGPNSTYITLSTPSFTSNAWTEGSLVIGSGAPIDISDVPFSVSINISQVVAFDPRPLKLTLVSTSISVKIQFGDMFSNEQEQNPVVAAFLQVLEAVTQSLIQNSNLATLYFQFFSGIIKNAMQIAIDKC